MRRYAVLFLTALWVFLPSPRAHAIEGLPGSTWGDVHWESNHPGDDDLILDGWVRQGVAWKTWEVGTEKSLVLDTYVTARYYVDSEGLDWYNYVGPGGGVSLDLYSPDGPALSAGYEYIHQFNFRSETERPYNSLFVNWYHWWDIREDNYPGSTWGDMRWELPTDGNDDDFIVEGWVRQGVVLKRWEDDGRTFVIDPYARVRYKYDSRGLDWNNYVGPGAGIALDVESPNGPIVSLGAEYGWERQWRSGDGVSRFEVYLRWYGWWDLMK